MSTSSLAAVALVVVMPLLCAVVALVLAVSALLRDFS